MFGGQRIFRIDWVLGSDRQRAVCHCGAERDFDGPVELWDWLLAHPVGHDAAAAPAPDPAVGPPAASSRAVEPATGSVISDAEVERDLVVAGKEVVASGVVRLTLQDPRGAPLPAWAPGSHIDLFLRADLLRQYSLCGDPADRTAYQVAVLREPAGRGGSAHVHDALDAGSRVRMRGPRNHFRLEPGGSYLFIAGGIGITPIMPMVDAVAARPDADWRLVYGGRSRASMAFGSDLLARHPGRVQLMPQDEVGLLDLAGMLDADATDCAVYCCGPEALLTAVESACAARGLRLHVERFAPKAGAADGSRAAFDVELARSGIRLTVAEDASILQTIEDAGIAVLSSCRQGTCGTCETAVLAGVPDHRDSVLTSDEQQAGDTMMICVSRSRSALLVLDR